MRFPKHVSVVWDIPMHLDINPALGGVHSHTYPPPPAGIGKVPIGMSADMPTIMAHPLGFMLGDNKLTTTVYHNHVWFALDGHDLGHGLTHFCLVPIPVPCIDMVTDILFSSRKAKFTASEVKANGKAVACCTIIDGLTPPTPMLICGTIPMPLAGCGMSVWLNELLVGMQWIDVLAGWVDVISTMGTEFIKGQLFEASIVEQVLGFSLLPDMGSLHGNLVRFLGQRYGESRGDYTFEYKPFGGPFLEVGESITGDGATGDVTRETSGRVGPGTAGLQSAERTVWRSGGTDHEVSSGVVGPAGAGRTRTLRSTDGGPYREVPSEATGPSLPWSEGTEVPFL